MNWFAPYRKTVSAVVTGIIGWVAVILASDSSGITGSEWLMGATVLATALGVYTFANAPTVKE